MKTGPTLSFLLLLLLGSSQADSFIESLLGDGVQVDDLEDADMDVGSIILNANNGSSEMLLEGDVLMPTNRNAMRCRNNYCRWKKDSKYVTVPITISNDFNGREIVKIGKALKAFHDNTCIRFAWRKNEADYISIENWSGCWSSFGRTGGRQALSLERSGCVHHGVIQHEILHALGFHHEHNRSDRDAYVKINWENIQRGLASQFRKRRTDNLDTPYDYSSVMHYGRYAFTVAKWRKETITPIPDASVFIGQRDGMTEIDYLRVNRLYGCEE